MDPALSRLRPGSVSRAPHWPTLIRLYSAAVLGELCEAPAFQRNGCTAAGFHLAASAAHP